MKEITIVASKENLNKILDLSHELLQENNCDSKTILNLDLVIEEIFVNIALYAYKDKKNENVKVRCEVRKDPRTFFLEFVDRGVKFNPLAKEDPNIRSKVEERDVGGLGIFLTKKLTDKINYSYQNKENHLSFEKKF